ncbi:MAG TPA: glycosyltransferase [Gemmatimonadaceae bacterium]|nr:glycosyltransferase [Gemmatimonadaceae bacterium]
MKLVIFGLSVSSSWGNGHATLWRGLVRALARRGHHVVFFERDVPYYAAHRDLTELPGGRLRLYPDWVGVRAEARRELADADVGMVTSYCPDGIAATELVLDAPVARVFYDLDTPVTLDRLAAGEPLPYIGPDGLRGFDLVLSYTGGEALRALETQLGAPCARPLYGSVDPDVHCPAGPVEAFRGDLSYLGTYAADRQPALERLLVDVARRCAERRFVIGGAQYPLDFPWASNIYFVQHLPPADHRAFYASSRLTLNVTRAAMARMGYCPSGRLFEAAACGAPVVSDRWEGLEHFYTPGEEILLADDADDVVAALDRSDEELRRIARAARERTLAQHTNDARAAELEALLDATATGGPASLARPMVTA